MSLPTVFGLFPNGDGVANVALRTLDPGPRVVGTSVINRYHLHFMLRIVTGGDAFQSIIYKTAFVVGGYNYGAGWQITVGHSGDRTVTHEKDCHKNEEAYLEQQCTEQEINEDAARQCFHTLEVQFLEVGMEIIHGIDGAEHQNLCAD